MLVVLSLIALGALAVRWGGWAFPAADLRSGAGASALAILVPLCIVTTARIFRRGPVTRQRIQGAIALYVLLGASRGRGIPLLALGRPGAFAGAVEGDGLTEWTYYSFVTLTTMGYGDITPVHPVARSLAVLEALIGQLYPAILLARLVSLELHSRQAREKDGASGEEGSYL